MAADKDGTDTIISKKEAQTFTPNPLPRKKNLL